MKHMEDKQDPIQDLVNAIEEDFTEGSQVEGWDAVGMHLDDNDIDDIQERIDRGEYNDKIEFKFLLLRECFKRDIELSAIGRPIEITPRIYNMLPELLTPDEFQAVNGFFGKAYTNPGKYTGDAMIKALTVFWDKLLVNVNSIVDLKKNVASNFHIKVCYTINGIPTRDSEIEFDITDTGITKRRIKTYIKKDKETGEEKEITKITEVKIWTWQGFRLLQVLRDQGESDTKYTYNYEFNGDFFQDKSLEYMKETIYSGHCKSTGKDKQIFGPLIKHYQHAGHIPVMDYTPVWGFTEDGWRMPDNYYIKFTPVQEPIRRNAYRMMQIKPLESEAKYLMRELYDAVTVDYKDILFAHAMIMPFLYALRPYTNIMPWLGLGSHKFNTGKSPAAILATTKIWNNLHRSCVSRDEADAESRLGDWLTASTFGVAIDDCGDLKEKVANTLKSYTTGETGFTRKHTDQTAKINRSFTSPFMLTYNKNPVLFDDTAFLARGIHVQLDTVPTDKQVKKFEGIWQQIRKGYFGRYIYEKLRDLTLDELRERYEDQPEWKNAPFPRSNNIYRLERLGADLFQELFGIHLDLGELPALIRETLRLGSDDYFTIVAFQIIDGQERVEIDEYQGQYVTRFQPTRSWIKSPIYQKNTEKYDGFFYTTDNLQDLNIRMKTAIKLSDLVEILKKRWKETSLERVKIKGTTMRAIYVPRKYTDPEAQGPFDLEEEPEPEVIKEGSMRDPARMHPGDRPVERVTPEAMDRTLSDLEKQILLSLGNMQDQLNDNPVPFYDILNRLLFDNHSRHDLIAGIDRMIKIGEIKKYVKNEKEFLFKEKK